MENRNFFAIFVYTFFFEDESILANDFLPLVTGTYRYIKKLNFNFKVEPHMASICNFLS